MDEKERIRKLARDIRDWLAGIELAVFADDVPDVEAVRVELARVEKTLEQITSEIILNR